MINTTNTKNSISDTNAKLYLDLMKSCLTHSLWNEKWKPYKANKRKLFLVAFFKKVIIKILNDQKLEIVRRVNINPKIREYGRDWPSSAQTMIGIKRLDNLQFCIEDVIRNNIPGDLIETGVWRGGATIFMRAVLKAYEVTDKTVWVADSFEGLPFPSKDKYPDDSDSKWHTYSELSISIEEVKKNFEKYKLLDNQVQFLKGWFKDTLPTAPIEKLCIIRLDGDMYESTMDALNSLYPKLSIGGYCIIDDYGLPDEACKKAVTKYREIQGITAEIIDIDGNGAYWKKT